jgi:hypothetical protein
MVGSKEAHLVGLTEVRLGGHTVASLVYGKVVLMVEQTDVQMVEQKVERKAGRTAG